MAINTNAGTQTAAGTGWDFIDITGTLTLGGLSIGNKFNLDLISLSSNTTAAWDSNSKTFPFPNSESAIA
jgi:hypothetical protein